MIAEVNVAHTHALLHRRYLARTGAPRPALRLCGGVCPPFIALCHCPQTAAFACGFRSHALPKSRVAPCVIGSWDAVTEI